MEAMTNRIRNRRNEREDTAASTAEIVGVGVTDFLLGVGFVGATWDAQHSKPRADMNSAVSGVGRLWRIENWKDWIDQADAVQWLGHVGSAVTGTRRTVNSTFGGTTCHFTLSKWPPWSSSASHWRWDSFRS